jgi:phosphatidylserine/phosphatidylglycerophosphate/cardiolipin synthase-like enzyme
VNLRFGHTSEGIMHNKFVIVDGKMIEIGSFNYTNHASKANQGRIRFTSNFDCGAIQKAL